MTVLLTIGSTYAFETFSLSAQKNPRVHANVFVTIENGLGVSAIPVHNVITDIGENYTAAAFWNYHIVADNVTYISLSNDGSAATGWTELAGEVAANGFSRAEGTIANWTDGSDDFAFNVTKKFTATGTQTLQTTGLHWDSTGESDGNLYACADFTQTEFNSGDNCTIRWVITYNAN